MKRTYVFMLVAALFMSLAPAFARAGEEEIARVEAASVVMGEFMNIPEDAISESLLKEAKGIAVFPNLIKAAFVLGGRHVGLHLLGEICLYTL